MSDEFTGVAASIGSVGGRLEAVLRIGALVTGAAYIVGFLIIAIQRARYGVYDVDFLRPKVVAAGVIFWILWVISALGAMSAFGRYKIVWDAFRLELPVSSAVLAITRALVLYPTFLLILVWVPQVYQYRVDAWPFPLMGMALATEVVSGIGRFV